MHTRRLERKDIPTITEITYHAWLDDELNEFLRPHRRQYAEDYHHDLLTFSRQRLVSPGVLGAVAVADAEDASPSGPRVGEVMGFSWFERVPHGVDYDAENAPASATMDHPEAEAQRQRDASINAGPIAALERGLLAIEARYKQFASRSRAASHENRARWVSFLASDRTLARLPSHWHVALLGCHPRYEGRGVGSQLVEYGIGLARQSGVPLSLESTHGRAQGLYTKKYGMRVIDWMDLPGQTFVGGAYCVFDPWNVWVRQIEEGEKYSLNGRPLTGEWIAQKQPST